MDIGILINQLVQLFIVICMGYLLYKVNIFNEEVIGKLTKLLLHVSLPAMIVSSVLSQTERPPVNEVVEVFIIAVAMFVLLPVISIIVVKLMRMPKEQQGLYILMTTFSNIGFMGFPIIDALYGEKGVFYAAIMNIMFNLAVFTYGTIMIHYGTDEKADLNLKKLITPGILCSAAAILIYAINIHFPSPVESAIDTIGSVTTPIAMLLIGATLAKMDIKSVFNDWRVYMFSVVKQLILPILMFYAAKIFIKNEFILGITLIMFLMPVANTALLFATEYNRDEKLAAKTVFITTLMSLATIPFGIWFCMR